jgi:hypothetical protein
VEGICHGLTYGSLPEFSWRDGEKSRRTSVSRDLNPGPREHEAGVLTTRLRRSVDHDDDDDDEGEEDSDDTDDY